jgi:hypothetical protein
MSETWLPTRDVEQPLGLRRDLADPEGVGAVGDQPIERDPEVDRDDVALRSNVISRDPVDDHRVRRDAERRRVAAIALRGGNAATLADVLLGEAVQLEHRNARDELLADHCERFGDDVARAGHAFDLLRALANDHRRRPFVRVVLAGREKPASQGRRERS